MFGFLQLYFDDIIQLGESQKNFLKNFLDGISGRIFQLGYTNII
jgi:hypothetical protein